MNYFFKSPRYQYITKVFGLDKIPTVYPAGTTPEEILTYFPSDGVSIGANQFGLFELYGTWVARTMTNDGYITFTFQPTSFPWNLEDTYGKLTFTVRVEIEETDIDVTLLTKVEYEVGEDFDENGMIVEVVRYDGSLVVVTDYVITGFDSSRPGTKTITVTYGEYTTTFTVTVQTEVNNAPGNKNDNGLGIALGAAVAVSAVAATAIFVTKRRKKV